MLLVADVGNTNTKIGVFDGERLLVSWRLTSRREQTADEYGLFIETLLQSRGIRAASVDGVSISNVVPPVQQTLEWMCEKYFDRPPYFVEPGVNTRMPLSVDAPREVGADRYVDRSEEHTSELQSQSHISYAVFCLKKKKAHIEIIHFIDIMFFLLASFMMVSLSQVHMKGIKVNLPTCVFFFNDTATTEIYT